MLRFSYFRSPDGDRWVLSGQLCGPWIEALRSLWRCFRYRAPRGHVVVGLEEVTAIDSAGAQLLADMQRVGVDFTERKIRENPVAKSGDACAAQSGDSRRAEDRQKP
jgi:ABC-type transporter Mla MlaB component